MPTIALRPGRKAARPTTYPEPASRPMVAAAAARPSSPGHGEPAVGRPGLGEDAMQGATRWRAHDETTRGRAAARVTTASKWGRSDGLVGRHHDGAALEPWFDRRRQAGDRGRVEGGGRLVEEEDGGGAQQGTGQGHPLAFARAQREPVMSERRPEPGGQVAQQFGQTDRSEHVQEVAVGSIGCP